LSELTLAVLAVRGERAVLKVSSGGLDEVSRPLEACEGSDQPPFDERAARDDNVQVCPAGGWNSWNSRGRHWIGSWWSSVETMPEMIPEKAQRVSHGVQNYLRGEDYE
jgi:hypothetical protein